MPRQIPTPSVSNLRSAAQTARAALNSGGGFSALAAALTAIAGALDEAQTAIETLEAKDRELASPDVLDPRARSTAYVSGDRIIGGVQVQGGLKTVAGQGLDFTFADQVASIASVDHGTGALLALLIKGIFPTSAAGLSAGTVWNDAGTLKVV